MIAKRLENIKPSPIFVVTSRAAALRAEGKSIITLSAGEPDFDTPEFIKSAARKAIADGHTKYTEVGGIPSLKKAIQQKFQWDYNLDCQPSNIIVGTGAKHILFNAFLATLDPGDEVILPAPFWSSFPEMIAAAEGVSVNVRSQKDFKISPEQLEKHITLKTKWVLINSPGNPGGAVYTRAELEALANVLRRHPHVWILSDDIYEKIVYAPHVFTSMAEVAPDLRDRILMVNGVSKSYAMTGWRIGYGVGPAEVIKAMETLQSQSTSSPCSISQYAALAALDAPQDFVKGFVDIFESRRQMVCEKINQIPGLSCTPPDGAFYVYVCCEGMMDRFKTDIDFSTYLLETAGIAVVPGTAFGLSPYIRLSFAANESVLSDALDRMKKALL